MLSRLIALALGLLMMGSVAHSQASTQAESSPSAVSEGPSDNPGLRHGPSSNAIANMPRDLLYMRFFRTTDHARFADQIAQFELPVPSVCESLYDDGTVWQPTLANADTYYSTAHLNRLYQFHLCLALDDKPDRALVMIQTAEALSETMGLAYFRLRYLLEIARFPEAPVPLRSRAADTVLAYGPQFAADAGLSVHEWVELRQLAASLRAFEPSGPGQSGSDG
ncbi:MAG: hypothetical protein GYB36_14575 [Alphaproteobacteria bacterium]|nr:hypothetical protein [Alphaproteobacteria bacterium]